MKRNAIARIVIYSILVFVLSGILLFGILAGSFMFDFDSSSGTVVESGSSVDAADIKRIEIEWASGSISIRPGDTDRIIFTESAPEDSKYPMIYDLSDSTLKLSYAKSSIGFGFGNFSMPSKDLVITVPRDWHCEDLEIDGASLNIAIEDLSIGEISLDGASCDLKFTGIIDSIDIDGASNDVTLACANRVSRIELDGASCELDLWLTEDCGFRLQMDGLSCDFDCNLNYSESGGYYRYGDEHCRIQIDGVSCDVSIRTMQEIS